MGVKHLTLYGSVARDTQHPGSDVDLAAEFNRPDQPVGLFQFARIEEHLTQLLAQPVDLTTPEGLVPYVRAGYERECVLVF